MFVVLIKNLIVNGCSFTYETPTSWATTIQKYLEPVYYNNLAFSGAGNTYICNGTVELLESIKLPPNETLVIIMWSGIGRKDIRISNDWVDQFEFTNHGYLFSGGVGAGWTHNKVTRQLFEKWYSLSDEESMCKDSVVHFKLLESYLNLKGYRYLFTSYFDYWLSTKFNWISGDICIPYSFKEYNYDYSNWITPCLGEYAYNKNGLDKTFHPTQDCHQQYAEEIILPFLR